MTLKSPGAFRFAFTAGACLLLLPLKLARGWTIAPALALVSAWVADATFLFLLCALGIWLGGSKPVRRLLLGGLVFVALELPAMIAITAHTYFLETAVGRRWALVDATGPLLQFVVEEVIPRSVLWGAGAAFTLLCATALVVARRVSVPRARTALIVLAVTTAAVVLHQARTPFYPSVLWEVGLDVAEVLSHPAVTGPIDATSLEDSGTGRSAVWPERSPFDKVIVFVMESVAQRLLEERMTDLPPEHFFNRERAHTHTYTSYFTTNMDSRTGMLAMLFSRLVPFEAYSEADVPRYEFLKNERSLVDDIAARGYTPAVAASQIGGEMIVMELPSWQDTLLLTEQEYATPRGFLCLNPYEFEKGCEDKRFLPRIFEELDARKKVFLFQEALYGHDESYENRLGTTPVQYYGEYLQAVRDHLAARGELDRTLIVVTSDHGMRDGEDRTRRWTYRLPLLVINPRFSREERTGLYNQSDFAALLAAEMAGVPPPRTRATSLFVGGTNTSILGSVTAEGDLLVVRDRRWSRYVLAEGFCPGDNAPSAPARRAVSAAALVGRFQILRDAFRPGTEPPPPAVPPTVSK